MAIKEKPEMFEDKEQQKEMFAEKKGFKVWIFKNLSFFILIGAVVGLAIALMTTDFQSSEDTIPDTPSPDKINTLFAELSMLRKEMKTLDDKLTSFRDQYLDNRQNVVRNMQTFSNFISTETQLRTTRQEDIRMMNQKIRNIEEYLNTDREFRQIYQGDVREIRQDMHELVQTLVQIERNLPDSHKHNQ